MIIALLTPKRQFLTSLLCGLFKQFRFQLFNEEGIGHALVYKDVVEIAVREA